jgi:hypothetical protein
MASIVEKLRGLAGGSAALGEVRITFSVPTPVSAEPPPELARLHLGKRDADHNGPLEYLSGCRKEARALSRCTLAPGKRLQVTDEFASHFVLIAAKHIKTHSDDGGIPDNDRRKAILDTTSAVIGYLIDSYKVAFRKLYGGTPAGAAGSREFELSAFRILELTKLLQRVLGLRYQVLTGPAWLSVNTVYHVMRAAGRDTVPIEPLETDLLEDSDAPPQSVAEMFLAIQMIARFDILKWPTELHQFLFAYCKSIGFLGELIADDGAALRRNTSLAYCYDTRQARMVRANAAETLGPSVVIDWTKMIKKITNDMIVFFGPATKVDLSYFQKRLETMTYNGCLSLVQLQFDCFTDERPHAAIDTGRGEACDMRIFIGFKSVYELLHNIHRGKYGIGNRLDDVLAKRSAVFADDDVATVESVWFRQYEDKDLVRLKTQESKFTTSMRIGMMAAYGVGNDGIAKPLFGMIARIFRPSAGEVIVDIVKHGEYLEPLLVSSDAAAFDGKDRSAGLVLGAILVKATQGDTKLLLPPLSTLREQARLVMKRMTSREPITLGKLQTVTRDFFLFRLS